LKGSCPKKAGLRTELGKIERFLSEEGKTSDKVGKINWLLSEEDIGIRTEPSNIR